MTIKDMEPYWLDEKDWLCAVEFLPMNDEESRGWGAEAIGYLFGYAHLTDTRVLAVIGDRKDEAYEILFSFSSSDNKRQFLDLVRTNENFGDSYINEDLKVPTSAEIVKARPLSIVLPPDVLGHATLIAASLSAGSTPNVPVS